MTTKLKRIGIALLMLMLMILSIILSWTYSYATIPKISALEKQIAVDDEGNSYVLYNDEIGNQIFKLDKNGNTLSFYSEFNSKNFANTYITEIMQYKGTLYAVRQSIDEVTNFLVCQDIIALDCDEKWIKPKVIYTYQGVSIPPISSITAEDDKLYVCSIKNGGEKAFVDVIPMNEPYKISETMEFSAQFNNGFYYGAFHNDRLYTVTKSGEVLEYYGNSMKNILSSQENNYGRITRLSIGSKGIRFYDDLTGDEFYYSDLSEISRKTTPTDIKISTWAESENYLLCLSENANLEDKLTITSDESQEEILKITIPFKTHVVRIAPTVVFVFFLFLAMSLIIVIISHFAKRQKRILAKFIIIIMPVLLIAFYIFGVTQNYSLYRTLTDTRYVMAEELNNLTKKAIDVATLEKLDSPQEYKTYEYRVMQNTLRTGNSENSVDSLIVKNEVMVLKNDELYTGVSLDLPCLYNVKSVYPSQLVWLMQQALTDNTTVTQEVADRYVEWIVSASPIVNLGGKNVGVILTSVSVADIDVYLDDYQDRYMLTVLIVFLFILIPIIMSFRNILRPLRTLENGMERIMEGKYDTVIDNNSRDEFQGITIGFNKMCTDISLKIYQLNNISNSYYRFMPRSVFKLLKKESILDVNVGDLQSLNCSISVMSLHNLSQLRSLMSNMEFMAYIEKITGYINEEIGHTNGVLMSSDMDLSRLKVIFPNNTFDATEFALKASEYFHSVQMQVKGISPDVTFVLHYTDMLYGITGKNDLIFPFLMSSEVDFMTQIVQRFGRSGARTVMTKEFIDKSQNKVNSRYIGYMLQDKTKRYELYQMLPIGAFDSQHLSQEKTFATGLELFYKGNFYDARNLFSLALKTMPDSGVARWYILAADKYYQYPDQYINHELFGTDILLK